MMRPRRKAKKEEEPQRLRLKRQICYWGMAGMMGLAPIAVVIHQPAVAAYYDTGFVSNSTRLLMTEQTVGQGPLTRDKVQQAAVSYFKAMLASGDYVETNGNNSSKAIDHLSFGMYTDVPWCALAVTWGWAMVLEDLGIHPITYGGETYTKALKKHPFLLARALNEGDDDGVMSFQRWGELEKRFHKIQRRAGYYPKASDAILFKTGGQGHTGILISVTKDKLVTIEGNSGDKMTRHEYKDWRSGNKIQLQKDGTWLKSGRIVGLIDMLPTDKQLGIDGSTSAPDESARSTDSADIATLTGYSHRDEPQVGQPMAPIKGYGSRLERGDEKPLPVSGYGQRLPARMVTPQPVDVQPATAGGFTPLPSSPSPTPTGDTVPPSARPETLYVPEEDEWSEWRSSSQTPPAERDQPAASVPGYSDRMAAATQAADAATSPRIERQLLLKIPTNLRKKFEKTTWTKIRPNIELYKRVGARHRIPWQILAGIHQREDQDCKKSAMEGESFGTKGEVSGRSFDNLEDSLDAAAVHLKYMLKIVYHERLEEYGNTLDTLLKAATSNQVGRRYEQFGIQPTKSPYAANGLDADHRDMEWTGYETARKEVQDKLNRIKKDGNSFGAITVYILLGGEVLAA